MSYTSDQISALDWAYSMRSTYNIAAVNMSLGGGSNSSYCDAANSAQKASIDNLRVAGIATIIASGNSSYTNSISAPACISTAVSVGATSKEDTVASYSNSAAILDLLAPGAAIYSSIPGNGYVSWNGTSMATPHVTGAWAVMKSKKPTATVDEVLAALTTAGVSVTDSRISITNALSLMNSVSVMLASDKASPQVAGTTVTFTGSGSGGTGSYDYEFWLKTPSGTWTKQQAYGSGATWAWNTSGLAAGTYTAELHVKTAGSAPASGHYVWKQLPYIIQ